MFRQIPLIFIVVRLATSEEYSTAACGATIDDNSGTINSPSYPNVYPSDVKCTWKLYNSPPNRITLYFTDFDLEGEPDDCTKDKLEIYSTVNGALELRDVYCGSAAPEMFSFGEELLTIVFTSDSDVQNTGFSIDYFRALDACSINNANCRHGCVNTTGTVECVCSEGYTLQENGRDCYNTDNYCSFEVSMPGATFTSPNYPRNYSNHLECWWIFTITPGFVIGLDFMPFETEKEYDVVTIYSGLTTDSVSSKNSGGNGGNTGFLTITASSEILMSFITNDVETRRGFQGTLLTYRNKRTGKMRASPTEEQYIYSHPDFGYDNYASNTTWDWVITAEDGYYITLTFPIFHVQAADKCSRDYIQIYDGIDATGYDLGRYCDIYSEPPSNLSSAYNAISIHFVTDATMNYRGFRIGYKAMRQV